MRLVIKIAKSQAEAAEVSLTKNLQALTPNNLATTVQNVA